MLNIVDGKEKGKVIPVQAYRGPKEIETPGISRQFLHERGKVVSSRHRPS